MRSHDALWPSCSHMHDGGTDASDQGSHNACYESILGCLCQHCNGFQIVVNKGCWLQQCMYSIYIYIYIYVCVCVCVYIGQNRVHSCPCKVNRQIAINNTWKSLFTFKFKVLFH